MSFLEFEESHATHSWSLIAFGALVGIAAGFAVPLATSYQSADVLSVTPFETTRMSVLEIPSIGSPASASEVDPKIEIERLAVRNRRLLALLAALKRRQATQAKTMVEEPARQLQSKAVFEPN